MMDKKAIIEAANRNDEAYVNAYLYSTYTQQSAEKMTESYGIKLLEAIRKFMYSETYRMLIDPKLEMFEFEPREIFSMWESEQKTGNPRNSVYIRCD